MNFIEESIYFQNGYAGITLAGMLLKPTNSKHHYPPILLIAGYGKNDRDCTGLGHQYFKTIAECFANQGFPVFRYDKRGVGQSQGDYDSATTFDFMTDAESACSVLRSHEDLDADDFIVIGHSEGGLIASMLHEQRGDILCSILIAPALVNSKEYFLQTSAQQLQADGATVEFIAHDRVIRSQIYDIVMSEKDRNFAADTLRQAMTDYFASLSVEDIALAGKLPFAFTAAKMDALIAVYNGNWYRYFWSYDIKKMLHHCNGPMLALCGDQDKIIIPTEIAKTMQKYCDDYEALPEYCFVKVLPDLNHRLQHCQTGALAEYMTIKEAIDPKALDYMLKWLKTMV